MASKQLASRAPLRIDLGRDHAARCAHFGGVASAAFLRAQRLLLTAVEVGEAGDLVLCGSRRHVAAARTAHERGAAVLTLPSLGAALGLGEDARLWQHAHAPWVFSQLLSASGYAPPPPQIAEDVVLEAGVVVHPGVVIESGARLGHGSVIGRQGFGLVEAPDGTPMPIPHLGGVHLGPGFSCGAYCTLDAGVLLPTQTGADCALDSHVHLGHNVVLGARVRIAAQAGLAGSVHIGDEVWIGGQAGIADHVRVGRRARIAAKAGVIGDIAEGAVVAGYPAVARVRWLRGQARLLRGHR